MRASILIRLNLLLLGWLLAAGTGHARSLAIEQFQADIQVLSGGDLLVTETIRPRFTGSWNGLKRDIPVEYRTPQGFNYTLLLDLVSVTDDHQAPLTYESFRDRHYRSVKIWLPGAQDTTKTLILTYRVTNGLKYFEDHDELYWNVTGDEWDVPIESASARVQLPANATGIKALAFSGAYGAREQQADVRIDGSEILYRMTRPLGFREGLTAVVGWDKGLVDEPGPLQLTRLFLRYNWPLALPVGVFGVMWYLWYTRGRDPRLRPTIVSYEPPDQLTPAELGTLVDSSPDLRDITATLVDLAVRGYLRIEERQEPKLLGLWSSTGYHLHRLQPSSTWEGLKGHEAAVLRGIFEAKLFSEDRAETVALSDLANRFYARLDGIRSSLFNQLVTRGYYARRPDRVKQAYTIGGIVVAVAAVFGSAWLSERFGLAFQTGASASVLSGLIIIGFGRIMPARTIRGTRALEKVLGFEEFLTRVESDRFERLVKTPEMFEKFLPFAMALGVEKNWTNAFDGIYTQPPTWYQGSNIAEFRPRNLTGNLSQLSAAASTAMTSAPRSSGGSGFSSSGSRGSSGGFSGGGFGGGGGSGF